MTKRPLPDRMRMRDLVVAAAAAQNSRDTVTKSSVTRPCCARRSPSLWTAAVPARSPTCARKGLRSSIGELLTCPFCMDVWAISGLTAGRVFAPEATGVVTDALAALAGADFLQLAYARAQQAAE